MASILKTDKIEGVTASGTVQMPAGHVVQTQAYDIDTETTFTSTSFTDTGLTGTITPKFSTSKILMIVTFSNYASVSSSTYMWYTFRLARTVGGTTTAIHNDTSVSSSLNIGWGNLSSAIGMENGTQACYSYLDSPSTTSQITYKVQGAGRSGTAITINDASDHSHLLLQEIAQ
tara:strand:+ start:1528 stop:2049 length:522 start_codon:yes stop_codon:yes gene_type:complete